MAKSKKSLTEVGLPKEFCRWNDKRDCWEVHISICNRHPNNPRRKSEYDPETPAQQRLMLSIEAEHWGGVHELCKSYVKDRRVELLVGHRRHAACGNLVKKYEDDPDKAETFAWIPMIIVDEPTSELDTLLHMHTANNLNEKWDFLMDLDFAETIFAAANREGYDITDEETMDELGAAIGWTEGRFPVYVAVSRSPVLKKAAKSYTRCTYKTWRSAVDIGKILLSRRMDDVIYDLAQARGLPVPNRKSSKAHGAPDYPKKPTKKMQEFVYGLIVDKVSYYSRNRKCQVGAVLERIKKPLRNSKFPTVRIQQWLTHDIDLTPNLPISFERETDGRRRNEIEAKFVTVSEEFTKPQLIKVSDVDIADRMDTVTYNVADGTCESGGVKVTAHTRTRRNKDSHTGGNTSKTTRISHTVSIPGASKRAYGLLRQQLEPILTDPKLLALCNETQRSLLQSANKIIQQG